LRPPPTPPLCRRPGCAPSRAAPRVGRRVRRRTETRRLARGRGSKAVARLSSLKQAGRAGEAPPAYPGDVPVVVSVLSGSALIASSFCRCSCWLPAHRRGRPSLAPTQLLPVQLLVAARQPRFHRGIELRQLLVEAAGQCAKDRVGLFRRLCAGGAAECPQAAALRA